MFIVRKGEQKDYRKIYECTLKLVKHHKHEENRSQLEQSGLSQILEEGFVSSLVIVEEEKEGTSHEDNAVSSDNIIGCMLYYKTFSLLNCGEGLILDQFFIDDGYRGKGLGKTMLQKLGEYANMISAKYIQVVFQEYLGLEQFYNRFSFKNTTKSAPYLNIFELYGRDELSRVCKLSYSEIYNNSTRLVDEEEIYVLENRFTAYKLQYQLSEEAFSTDLLIEFPILICTETSELVEYPSPQLVIILKVYTQTGNNSTRTIIKILKGLYRITRCEPSASAVGLWRAISNLDMALLREYGFRVCAFLEKPSVCCWLGKTFTTSDLVGDTSIYTEEILTDRIKTWALKWPTLLAAIWEVECNEEAKPDPIANLFNRLDIPNDTKSEGWNVAYLCSQDFNRITSSEIH